MSEKELGNSTKPGEIEVDYAVVTDDHEHQDWRWCTREETEKMAFVSEQGLAIAQNAFSAYEKRSSLKAEGVSN